MCFVEHLSNKRGFERIIIIYFSYEKYFSFHIIYISFSFSFFFFEPTFSLDFFLLANEPPNHNKHSHTQTKYKTNPITGSRVGLLNTPSRILIFLKKKVTPPFSRKTTSLFLRTPHRMEERPAEQCKSYNGGKPFPCILEPTNPGTTWVQTQAYLRKNREQIMDLVDSRGAVVLRGSSIENPEELTSLADAMNLEHKPYVGGAAVRNIICGSRVFTTNESPPLEPIPFHHEMAQVPSPPSHVIFYCMVPPKVGGSTPLIDSHHVYQYFSTNHPEFAAKVEKLGLRYVRIMPCDDDPTSAIGRGWKSTYLSADQRSLEMDEMKAIAEAKMKELGIEFEWLESGNLKTITAVLPGVRTEEKTGKKVFFNSMVAAFLGWVDCRNDPTKAVMLGDNTYVDATVIGDVAKFMERERVMLPWKKGDVMIVNNSLVMHSREPFERPRRIFASVIEKRPAEKTFANDIEKVVDQTPLGVLNTGDSLPMVGYGLWKVPKDVCKKMVVEAVKAGYRHFDGASVYGNEKEVGEGFKEAFESGLVKREELWITSKLWNTYHRKEHVKAACLKTLKDLGLEYLDLYLIHFPLALKYVDIEGPNYPPAWSHPGAEGNVMQMDNVSLQETWQAMEELVDAGLVKNIGVANFNVGLLRDMLAYARIKPAVNQVELHPYLSQQKLVRFCREKSIHVTAYSSFGGASYEELGAKGTNALKDEVLKKIGEKYGKSGAQVALAWGVQRGTSVIPKTLNEKRLGENLDLFGFTLNEEDMKTIAALEKGERFNDSGVFAEAEFGLFCPMYE